MLILLVFQFNFINFLWCANECFWHHCHRPLFYTALIVVLTDHWQLLRIIILRTDPSHRNGALFISGFFSEIVRAVILLFLIENSTMNIITELKMHSMLFLTGFRGFDLGH